MLKVLTVGAALLLSTSYLVYLNRQNLLEKLRELAFTSGKLPKRIILVRHGESEGNVNKHIYKTVPDNSIELTGQGFEDALSAGNKIKAILGDERVDFYLSPYQRTLQTSRSILTRLDPRQIGRVVIEPRLREQEFGNFQDPGCFEEVYKERDAVGRFWYRFPSGESGANVYQRVASFWTDFQNTYLMFQNTGYRETGADNVLLVTHGLTMRFFLAVLFRWSPDTFETVYNPDNGEVWVLDLDQNGKYVLNSNEGIMPISERKVLIHLKDGTSEEHLIKNYIALPQPRTDHAKLAIQSLRLLPDMVDSIDWWNAKYRSNFIYNDNTSTHKGSL